MPFVLKLVCLCLLICLSGCERSSNAGCYSLDDGYSGFDVTEIRGLPTAGAREVPPVRFREVYSCWAENPYGGDRQYALRYVETRWLSSDEYYLVFEPAGITDVQIAFLIREPEGIVEAGSIGLL